MLPAEQRPQELVRFTPVVIAQLAPKPATRPARTSRPAAPAIEIEAKGVVVRVRDGADVLLVEAMLRALRARA